MAIWTVKRRFDLGKGLILAPERYDPRRSLLSSPSCRETQKAVLDVAKTARKVVHANTSGLGECYVLDTSDAREGVIVRPKRSIPGAELGSAKKVLEKNDVIISRLRPYLRQVALVDGGLCDWGANTHLLSSTEFFVLRSTDGRSISFLVPFLLSESVQKVLAASQEGGHHPRFDEATLLSLPLPSALLEHREEMSRKVDHMIHLYRQSEEGMEGLIRQAGKTFAEGNSSLDKAVA
jgi:hypothetical protein